MKLGLTLRRSDEAVETATAAPLPGLVIGGLPTVSLLPTELRAAVHERAVKRVLAFSVFTVVLIACGATGIAAVVASNAQAHLTAAQSNSQSLLNQVAKFKDVQELQQDNALSRAAVAVGGSTEIDWRDQVDAIEADMPSGYSITGITADSATPVADYPQGTTPIEMPRAASMQVTVTTRSITELPVWLRKLRSVPAYADAQPSISYDPESGYTVTLTMHLSKKAIVKAPAQESAR